MINEFYYIANICGHIFGIFQPTQENSTGLSIINKWITISQIVRGNNQSKTERLLKNAYIPIKSHFNAQQSDEGIFDHIKFIYV